MVKKSFSYFQNDLFSSKMGGGGAVNREFFIIILKFLFQSWLTVVESFNTSLKELGDISGWAGAIHQDLRTVASTLEYSAKVSQEINQGEDLQTVTLALEYSAKVGAMRYIKVGLCYSSRSQNCSFNTRKQFKGQLGDISGWVCAIHQDLRAVALTLENSSKVSYEIYQGGFDLIIKISVLMARFGIF